MVSDPQKPPPSNPRLFQKILSSGVRPDMDGERVRILRQVNGTALILIGFYLSGSVVFLLIMKNGLPWSVFSLILSVIYIFFVFSSGGKDSLASRRWLIYLFEIDVLLATFYSARRSEAGLFYSDAMYVFAIFPILAILFDSSALAHFFTAFLWMVVFYLVSFLFPQPLLWFIDTQGFKDPLSRGISIDRFITLAYLIPSVTTAVALLYRELTKTKADLVVFGERLKAESAARERETERRLKSVKELEIKVKEFEELNSVMVNRELKMIELKKEMERMKAASPNSNSPH